MSVTDHNSPLQHGLEEGPQCQSSEVVVGCRKSELALAQSRSVISALRQATPFKLLSKQTGRSDVGKSLWTNNLEADLVAGKAQLLVHSLKDMPTTLPPNCLLAAVPERQDPSDVVIMRSDSKFKSIDELPPGSVVGSSSSRRKALVRRNWPHLDVVESTAGLLRLGLGHWITQRLDPATFPYAAGQGALGVEVSIDRACSSPIGVCSTFEPLEAIEATGNEQLQAHKSPSLDRGKLYLKAAILDMAGTPEIFADDVAVVQCDSEAEQLGLSVAELLLGKSARSLLRVTTLEDITTKR
ncbi:periplasmic binding protein-like II [Colletotrichum somersetense]|nr:periplasmic binding protein-like II [Colletotrichum somersetense]